MRFELPAKRLPDKKLAVQIVAVAEDGERYSSRVFFVKGIINGVEEGRTGVE